MKMKKLLSIGALTLAMTCSVSVTAFAADNVKVNDPDVKVEYNDTLVMKELAKKIIKGETVHIGDKEFNKNTTVGTLIPNTKDIKAEIKKHNLYEKYKDNKAFKKYIGMISKDGNIASNGNKMLAEMTQEDYDTVIAITEDLINTINNETNGQYREDKEKIALDLVKHTMFNGYYVSFGKNKDGLTTLSVEKNGEITGQVTFKNVTDLLDILKKANVETIKGFVDKARAENK
ncbi:hypothetical protein [Clostridium weizhouense]|uniref:Uncharacterized protein n=1 Tax=Clostridium weizhouense TaxID=2859781 RepID=A0ABS7ANV0_9CLOT|nr:hypothetical protein [Clostridium weizhouense]MBW6410307.1 hypothetical protein [Clostridium weizhouense]